MSGIGSLSVSQHSIEFSRPVERALFLQQCKGKCVPKSLLNTFSRVSVSGSLIRQSADSV